jgi:uncharacterized membrane protein
MAFASLGLIYLLYRLRPDVCEEVGFGAMDVALLCLGSVAGWAVNLPLALFGGTYLAVNVGGTLVALILLGRLAWKRKLPLVRALVGTAVVTLVAWKIVLFDPDAGIIARYPTFFLPVLAAILYGLVVSLRKPAQSVPLAYATGTLGALIGADLLHVPEMRAHFAAAPENTIISIGGAGVFDMVFLAGTFAMAVDLGIVVALASRRPRPTKQAYPVKPLRVDDPHRVVRAFALLPQPNAFERALHGLAQSDLALQRGDHARSVRHSWLAVQAMLADERVRAFLANGVPPKLRADVQKLALQHATLAAAGAAPQTLREAGEANVAAKTLVAALAPKAKLAPSPPPRRPTAPPPAAQEVPA